jgi:hypothetical protein
MDWNCTLTEERLSDYLEAQLGATESAALAAHCERCARCARLVAQVGGLLGEIHALEPLQEPQNLQARILEATLGRRAKKQGWRRWFAWTPAIWQPRFAIGMATVAVCALVVIQAGGVLPTKMHKANLNPADILRSMTRQAHLTYAQGVKFVNNLRVVYEIESRLETQNPQAQAPSQPEQNNLQQNRNSPQEKSDKRPGRSESRNAIYCAGSTPSPADSTAEQATSAQAHAIQSGQTSETQPGRSATRNNPQFACVAMGDPNLNRGFPAVIEQPIPAVASVAAGGLAADGPTKPEWSAP